MPCPSPQALVELQLYKVYLETSERRGECVFELPNILSCVCVCVSNPVGLLLSFLKGREFRIFLPKEERDVALSNLPHFTR